MCNEEIHGTAHCTSDAACLGSSDARWGEWEFKRKVDHCPWVSVAGADSTIRPMADVLKDIIGQQVDVVNVEGGGGSNGVEFTTNNRQTATPLCWARRA